MANIVEHRKFSCTNLSNNNNKYWNVTLYDNDDVISVWGRQGGPIQSKTWNGKGRSFMEQKIKEKNRKGYYENKVVEGTGSKASTSAVANTELKDIASKQIKSKNPIVAKLIDFLVQVNAHSILKATNGQITFDVSQDSFKTTQGIVLPVQVTRARNLLANLYDGVIKGNYIDNDFEENLNEYLSLIPRDFGMKRRSPHDILPDISTIQKENDILDSLDASFAGLKTATPKKGTEKKDTPQIFNVEMEIIEDNKILSHVKHLYQSTRKSMHQSNNLSVQTVYAVTIKNMKNNFDSHGAKMKNIWQLWHGTKASNLLSIMRQGLIIPPSSSGHVTGRMYGNGVYFSDISTKALNYATNFWGGGGNTDKTFMFLADVAMGNYHIAQSSWDKYPKLNSDSTWAKGKDKGGVNSGVVNDEMIVYKLSQCNLVYLVEFVPRDRR